MTPTERAALEAAYDIIVDLAGASSRVPAEAQIAAVLDRIIAALNPPTPSPTFTARYGAGLGAALDAYAGREGHLQVDQDRV